IIDMGVDKKFWDNRILTSLLASWRVNLIHFYTTSRTFPDGAFNPDTDLATAKSRATDLIWQGGYNDQWNWFGNEALIGFELREASGSNVEQDAFGGNVVETSPRETDLGYRPENFGLFWRDTINLAQHVIAHFGMRHDFHKLKTRDHLTPTNDLSRRWRDMSVSAGLTLKPVDFVDLFGNYSQGFRVPTVSEVAPFSSGITNELNPEGTDSYEVGTRLRYQKLAQAKVSFFLIDLKNEIVFDSSSITATTPFGRNVNIGKSRREGAETRLDLIPIPEIDAYGSYTWMKAYVREAVSDPVTSGSPFDGRDLGSVPRHRFTAGLATRPLYRLGTFFEGLRISIDGVYTGRQFIESHESTTQDLIDVTGETVDPYMIWDLMISFEWKGKQIYFKINNLFDKHYYSRAVAATNFGSNITPGGSHLFVNPGAPREFLVGTKWEFGK
ncbi:MAG: TonB-dependent receptor, partial [Candidatus Omnitrophica bacterium]|nr:TonB-dependent receptor [Candidatus Omnitrophota bacterium]